MANFTLVPSNLFSLLKNVIFNAKNVWMKWNNNQMKAWNFSFHFVKLSDNLNVNILRNLKFKTKKKFYGTRIYFFSDSLVEKANSSKLEILTRCSLTFWNMKIYISEGYSYLSNKRRVANNRRVWKIYLNLINDGSGTNGGPGIFVTLYKKDFENSHFLRFSTNFSLTFFKNK